VELVLNSVPNTIGKDGRVLTSGPLKLDSVSHRAAWDGKEVRLTLTEFEIVKLIVSRAGQDVEFKEIHALIHEEGFAVGYGPEGYRGNVRTFIKRIRQKFCEIDKAFEAFENYPGFGYRWSLQNNDPGHLKYPEK
jgi:two-component system response regulator ChvI